MHMYSSCIFVQVGRLSSPNPSDMKMRFTWPTSLAVVSAASLALSLPDSARAQQSTFDWKQASGTKLVVMLNKHPYADAIIKRLQQV